MTVITHAQFGECTLPQVLFISFTKIVEVTLSNLCTVYEDEKYIYEVTSEFFTLLYLPPSWRCIETKSILFAADYVPEERVVEHS